VQETTPTYEALGQ